MKELNRIKLFQHVETLMAQYCEGCFLYHHLKEENGRKYAHRFCISQCTVGEKIKEYGKILSEEK